MENPNNYNIKTRILHPPTPSAANCLSHKALAETKTPPDKAALTITGGARVLAKDTVFASFLPRQKGRPAAGGCRN
jgi:hypothetical protein